MRPGICTPAPPKNKTPNDPLPAGCSRIPASDAAKSSEKNNRNEGVHHATGRERTRGPTRARGELQLRSPARGTIARLPLEVGPPGWRIAGTKLRVLTREFKGPSREPKILPRVRAVRPRETAAETARAAPAPRDNKQR
jgi:hypothetical protein